MTNLLQDSRRPDLKFHISGKIDISARIAKSLALRAGDVVDIAVDRGEWYLYVKHRAGQYQGQHRATVRQCGRGCGTFRCWCKPLAARVLELNPGADIVRLACGESKTIDNKTYITIIYRRTL